MLVVIVYEPKHIKPRNARYAGEKTAAVTVVYERDQREKLVRPLYQSPTRSTPRGRHCRAEHRRKGDCHVVSLSVWRPVGPLRTHADTIRGARRPGPAAIEHADGQGAGRRAAKPAAQVSSAQ